MARRFVKLNEGQNKVTYPRSSIHLKGSMKVTINKQVKVYPLPASYLPQNQETPDKAFAACFLE